MYDARNLQLVQDLSNFPGDKVGITSFDASTPVLVFAFVALFASTYHIERIGTTFHLQYVDILSTMNH
jgi:hypothetical protein